MASYAGSVRPVQDLTRIRMDLAEVLRQAQLDGADAALLMGVSDGVRDACHELEQRLYRSTPAQVKHFRRIEATLHGFTPGEVRDAICARMRIGRSRYFQLRALVHSPDR